MYFCMVSTRWLEVAQRVWTIQFFVSFNFGVFPKNIWVKFDYFWLNSIVSGNSVRFSVIFRYFRFLIFKQKNSKNKPNRIENRTNFQNHSEPNRSQENIYILKNYSYMV